MTNIETVKKYLADACEVLGDGALPTQLGTILVAHMLCQLEMCRSSNDFEKRMTEAAEQMNKRSEIMRKNKTEEDDDKPKVN